jgi:hypothetical protein
MLPRALKPVATSNAPQRRKISACALLVVAVRSTAVCSLHRESIGSTADSNPNGSACNGLVQLAYSDRIGNESTRVRAPHRTAPQAGYRL